MFFSVNVWYFLEPGNRLIYFPTNSGKIASSKRGFTSSFLLIPKLAIKANLLKVGTSCGPNKEVTNFSICEGHLCLYYSRIILFNCSPSFVTCRKESLGRSFKVSLRSLNGHFISRQGGTHPLHENSTNPSGVAPR